METTPTTLLEYTDDERDEASAGDDGVTPAKNAESIQHLVDVVDRLTDKVGTLANDLGQLDVSEVSGGDVPETDADGYTPEGENTTTERMYQ